MTPRCVGNSSEHQKPANGRQTLQHTERRVDTLTPCACTRRPETGRLAGWWAGVRRTVGSLDARREAHELTKPQRRCRRCFDARCMSQSVGTSEWNSRTRLSRQSVALARSAGAMSFGQRVQVLGLLALSACSSTSGAFESRHAVITNAPPAYRKKSRKRNKGSM